MNSWRQSYLKNMDKIRIYSGLFGLSLFLHYLTPYYQNQSVPSLLGSVVEAPLIEELAYRLFGIIVPYYCLRRIENTQQVQEKINWGMLFVISIYFEFGLQIQEIKDILPSDSVYITLIVIFLFFGLILLFNEYKMEILLLTSSLTWALGHESYRVFPVFITGIFFGLLCINKSRITQIQNQNWKVIILLLIYGAIPGYIIHLWNNFIGWVLFSEFYPIIIDITSLIGVIVILLLLDLSINQYIDQNLKIKLMQVNQNTLSTNQLGD